MWKNYYFASSVEDALKTLEKWQGKARLMAGGTDLVIDVKKGKHTPDCIVDTSRISGLDEIKEEEGYIYVGANVTFHNIWTSPLVNQNGSVLAEAAYRVAAWSVQNVGTLAGNVVTAQPAADGSMALVALGAEAEIVSLNGKHWYAVSSLFAGPGKSRIDPTREMITRFRWRKPLSLQASVYERIAKREVMSLPIACCGVDLKLTADRQHIDWVRISLGPVAETPFRATCAEDFLKGAECNPETFTDAAEQAVFACVFRTSKLRATREYRYEVVKVMIKRALIRAVEIAKEGNKPDVAGNFQWGHRWSDGKSLQAIDGKIVFTLNGEERTVETAPDTMLSYLLREELGLTGTKVACGEGECGACTVLVDNQPVVSCIFPAIKAHGRNIQTIEGVAKEGQLHPIQEALLYNDAVQCGYCIPGMVLASKSLLEGTPDPTPEEIKVGLGNNYCRCTGYKKIIDAVSDAAAVLRGDQEKVNQSIRPRKDALAKITGEERYAGDMSFKGMLHGRIVWSEYPHAEILSIDTSEAESLPGVVKVVTSKDVPGKNLFGSMGYDQPALAENKVLYVGEAVAVVFAESKEIAKLGVEKVKVEYRPLPGIFNPEQALSPDAPILKDEDNVFHRSLVEKGNIEDGFVHADVIIEDDYSTQAVEHAYLETESGIGLMDGDVVTIYQATQWPPGDQMQLADIMGLPKDKIRVIQTAVGGAFGGKMDLTIQPLLALGTYLTGRPVKIVLERSESIRMHVKRHPYYMHYKLGATKEGKFVALEAHLVADGGAYRSTGDDVLEQATIFSSGPYEIPNVRVTGMAVRTNNVTRGAMRGFGAQQITFAMESQIARLAQTLGMDPFELRRINAYDVGSTLVTGQVLNYCVGARPVLEAAEAGLKKYILPDPKPGKRIGVGVASGMKNVGLGLGNDDSVYSSMELLKDGTMLLRHGAIDLGQGAASVMQEIAARAVGVNINLVDAITGDTQQAMDGGITAASRQTHITGQAVYDVSVKFKDLMLDYAAKTYDVDQNQIEITKEGNFINAAEGKVLGNLRDLAESTVNKGEELKLDYHYRPKKTYRILSKEQQEEAKLDSDSYVNYPSFCNGCQVAVVEVDEETGQVDVLNIISAHDSGTAIRLSSVEGQIEGGVYMGIGYALTEDFIEDNGVVLSDSLYKLTLPRSTNPAHVEAIVVERCQPCGPFGAKGMGEAAYVPTAAAIINAIDDAVGIRIKNLPASREKVLAAIKEKQQAGS